MVRQDGPLQIVASPNVNGSAPTAATVGTSASTILTANPGRTLVLLTLTTSSNPTSIAISGQTAVLGSGIALVNAGDWVLLEGTEATGAISAIATSASANLAIQALIQA